MKNVIVHEKFTNHHNGASESRTMAFVGDEYFEVVMPNRPPDEADGLTGPHLYRLGAFPNGYADRQVWFLGDEEAASLLEGKRNAEKAYMDQLKAVPIQLVWRYAWEMMDWSSDMIARHFKVDRDTVIDYLETMTWTNLACTRAGEAFYTLYFTPEIG